jgi:hypothetical protein
MKPTTEGVAMTEIKQESKPQSSTWFRKTVTGSSLLYSGEEAASCRHSQTPAAKFSARLGRVLCMACLAGGLHSQAQTPSKVDIVQTEAGYQLYRNGKPFYIKGAVFWADPNDVVPLKTLAQCGANSLRTSARRLQHLDAVLASARDLGLSVILELPVKKGAVDRFDYDDAQAVHHQCDEICQMVEKYKNHPALLLWGVGNELSVQYTNRNVWSAVNRLAQRIHQLDGNHPTMTAIGEDSLRNGDLREICRRCPDLDILGVNTYKNIALTPQRIADAGWTKPYIITEWGPTGHWQTPKTRWKIAIEEISTEKAKMFLERYQKVIAKQTRQCLGSTAFIWHYKQERTHTWYGMHLASGERTEPVNCMQFLWTDHWPSNRAPAINLLTIDNHTATNSVTLPPSTSHVAVLDVQEPDGDSMTFDWEILPEPQHFGYGGTGEEKPKALSGLIQENHGASIRFKSHDQPGSYRLFVIVRDGHNNAATANIPFLVTKQSLSSSGSTPDF